MSKIFHENGSWKQDAAKDYDLVLDLLCDKINELTGKGYALEEASFILTGAAGEAAICHRVNHRQDVAIK